MTVRPFTLGSVLFYLSTLHLSGIKHTQNRGKRREKKCITLLAFNSSIHPPSIDAAAVTYDVLLCNTDQETILLR